MARPSRGRLPPNVTSREAPPGLATRLLDCSFRLFNICLNNFTHAWPQAIHGPSHRHPLIWLLLIQSKAVCHGRAAGDECLTCRAGDMPFAALKARRFTIRWMAMRADSTPSALISASSTVMKPPSAAPVVPLGTSEPSEAAAFAPRTLCKGVT